VRITPSHPCVIITSHMHTLITHAQPQRHLMLAVRDVDIEYDDPAHTFELGERVVVIAGNVAVPFGARGTAIGVERRYVDVLLDERCERVV
jgi:hypothetical protein